MCSIYLQSNYFHLLRDAINLFIFIYRSKFVITAQRNMKQIHIQIKLKLETWKIRENPLAIAKIWWHVFGMKSTNCFILKYKVIFFVRLVKHFGAIKYRDREIERGREWGVWMRIWGFKDYFSWTSQHFCMRKFFF